MTNPKMVDLFTGIGGFSIAADGNFDVVAHVEKDPACQDVIRYHYPDCILLDDVCTADETNLPSADVVTFGSPCQDLSIAGKREGLAGKRSGLFYEAIRIIRATGAQIAVWENVPGALSSNDGEDFRVVVSEMLRSDVPMPRSGRWSTAGMVRTSEAEVCWRILDAQFFGVPQRRRRVFVVADYRGQRASQILFEAPGSDRYPTKGGKKGKKVAAAARSGADGNSQFEGLNKTVGALDAGGSGSSKAHGGAWPGTTVQSLMAGHGWAQTAFNIFTNDGGKSKRKDRPDGGFYVQETETALTVGGTDLTAIVGTLSPDGEEKGHTAPQDVTGNPQITGAVSSKWAKGTGGPAGDEAYNLILDTEWDNQRMRIHSGEISPTLATSDGGGGTRSPLFAFHSDRDGDSSEDLSPTLKHGGDNPSSHGHAPKIAIAYGIDSLHSNSMKSGNPDSGFHADEIVKTLDASGPDFTGNQGGTAIVDTLWHEHRQDETIRVQEDGVSPTVATNWGAGGGNVPLVGVRRLMPVECERLQGFPDDWTAHATSEKGKRIAQSDSARYRQCGNAVAVPVVRWILTRIREAMNE